MDNTGMSIDDYVESLYRGLDGHGDAAELKEEMRGHLEDAAQRLREEGYSEADSVRIAIERFGDEAAVRRDLSSLYASSPPLPPPGSGSGPTEGTSGIPPLQPSADVVPRKGVSALVLAILALFIPVAGLVLAVIGLVIAIRNLRRPGPTVVSPVVSGIALALAIVGILMQFLVFSGIVMYFGVATSGSATQVHYNQAVANAVGGP
ncbi:permease prefix domain 1-containing protein [Alicyclobacillus sp. ALC3]|uniref:permease prefix domain 1-containing protein n=1 Tax=Alicyclobacillus sp. ALC3 TaxID=2796143 RepID=UPI00237949EA|nr:permease prefix domain 1-containing protein [Alicyclobacillus sp. ALC3]WDL96159.1 DUF4126 domain-containing protein [Alicyclobacillus sp. ALC3]